MVDWTVEADAAAFLRADGIETDLDDTALHAKAKAAVDEIAHRGYGPRDVDLIAYGGSSLIALQPPAASIADVREEGTLLTADEDYRLRPGGLFLERIYSDRPSVWYGRITGTVTTRAADDRYDRVVSDLVKLALQYTGLDSIRSGDYSEEAAGARTGGQKGYQQQREDLIAELAPAEIGFA